MPHRQRSKLKEHVVQIIAIIAVVIATRLLLFTDKPGAPPSIPAEQNIIHEDEIKKTHEDLTTSSEKYLCPAVQSTEQVVAELKDIIKLVQSNHNGPQQQFQPLVEQLVKITQSLDPFYNLFTSKKPAVDKTKQNEFCPENFTHLSYAQSHFFLKGSWESEFCPDLIPLDKLVSIVLLASDVTKDCAKNHSLLLDAIQNTHPNMEVYIAADPTVCKISTLQNVHVSEYGTDRNYGRVWNSLVRKVKTPYVLIGRHLENFSWLTEIRRQVSIISQSEQVKVVGGSIRNATGYWEVGCYQTSLSDNVLEYKDGYYTSAHECMHCDHLLGPFVAKTSVIRDVPFNGELTQAVVFDDWFLQLKKCGYLVMNCPDAMYFFTDPDTNEKSVNRTVWLPLVKIWEINRIFLPDNVELAFSCNESGIQCSPENPILPICCVDQLAYNMYVFHEVSKSRNVWYNYIGAYVLGAVKFPGITPWRMLNDRFYYSAKEPSHWEIGGQTIGTKRHHFYIDHKQPGFSVIFSPDLYVSKQATTGVDTEQTIEEILMLKPTLMRVHGVWVHGPSSPGLHARNVYGKEYLKQYNSWDHVGKRSWNYQKYVENHIEVRRTPADFD